MVNECDLTDLADINSFISEWEGDSLGLIRNYFVTPGCHVLSLADKSMYFLLQRKSKKSAIMHIYVDKKSRGLKMFKFIKKVKEWGYKHTEYSFIFNYSDDYRVRMIMKYLGSKDIGVYQGQTVYKYVVKQRGN